jgi:hypothetical protein
MTNVNCKIDFMSDVFKHMTLCEAIIRLAYMCNYIYTLPLYMYTQHSPSTRRSW